MGNLLNSSESEPKSKKVEHNRSENLRSEDDLTKSSLNKLKNPGTVEDIHKECRDIMPSFYEGARLQVNRCLNNYFQLSHNIKLQSNGNGSFYRFGATYVGSKRKGVFETYPVLFGEIERNGSMQASVVHGLTDRIRLKFGAEYKENKLVGVQYITDYLGDTFTASAIIANPSIVTQSGVFVAHYLQSVTSNLGLGSELGLQYGSMHPQGVITVFNFTSRYVCESTIFSASLGGSGIHLSYMKEASPELKFGVEFNTNYDAQSTYTTFGYQVLVPKADLIFRGSLDTNWNICSVLEKTLKPLPFAFSLCALLNQKTGKFKMGCGLVIG